MKKSTGKKNNLKLSKVEPGDLIGLPVYKGPKLYVLSAEFGSVIHVGSKKECQLILKAFVAYGIREDKFYIDSEEKFYE